jgi:hypothetical protein
VHMNPKYGLPVMASRALCCKYLGRLGRDTSRPFICAYGFEVSVPLSISSPHRGGDIHQVAKDILGLTKLHYISCQLGEGHPITVRYSDRVGEILLATLRNSFFPMRHKSFSIRATLNGPEIDSMSTMISRIYESPRVQVHKTQSLGFGSTLKHTLRQVKIEMQSRNLIEMNSRRVLVIFLCILAAYGAVIGYYTPAEPPKALDFIFLPATVIPVYLWYRFDSKERNNQRTSLLGGAIIIFPLIAVPYYLFHSRPSGAKVDALLRFFGFLAMTFVIMLAAALPFAMVSRWG